MGRRSTSMAKFSKKTRISSTKLCTCVLCLLILIYIGLQYWLVLYGDGPNTNEWDIVMKTKQKKIIIRPNRSSSSSLSSSSSAVSILMNEVNNMMHRQLPADLEFDPFSSSTKNKIRWCGNTDTDTDTDTLPNTNNEKFSYDVGRMKKRRIFMGGLIADDSWHVLGTGALESYGIYHSIVFVESNRTQNYQPRPLRFAKGSENLRLLQSGIYGPNTTVDVDYFVYEEKAVGMTREHMMRSRILEKWKGLGMTQEDLGIIIDPDEVPSRKILRAVQVCNYDGADWNTTTTTTTTTTSTTTANNNNNNNNIQTCRSPMLRLSFPVMEGSPKCVVRGKTNEFMRFTSTSIIIGACIEGIGDANKHNIDGSGSNNSSSITLHSIPRGGNGYGHRGDGYGQNFNYDKIPLGINNDSGYFPLFNGADFRAMKTGNMHFPAGFHLHNFFDSSPQIRFKYRWYGHIHKDADTAPLGGLNADLNALVSCAHNRTTNTSDTTSTSTTVRSMPGNKKILHNGLTIINQTFGLPAAFQLRGYVDARHKELIGLVEEDEQQYGRVA